ncbi:hypothetical protein DL95DRAFT_381213, partial [Leptodontidium sp. 2 PMI_412]
MHFVSLASCSQSVPLLVLIRDLGSAIWNLFVWLLCCWTWLDLAGLGGVSVW